MFSLAAIPLDDMPVEGAIPRIAFCYEEFSNFLLCLIELYKVKITAIQGFVLDSWDGFP